MPSRRFLARVLASVVACGGLLSSASPTFPLDAPEGPYDTLLPDDGTHGRVLQSVAVKPSFVEPLRGSDSTSSGTQGGAALRAS